MPSITNYANRFHSSPYFQRTVQRYKYFGKYPNVLTIYCKIFS